MQKCMNLCFQARTRECERAWMSSCLSLVQTSVSKMRFGDLCGSWKVSKRVLKETKPKIPVTMRDYHKNVLFSCF